MTARLRTLKAANAAKKLPGVQVCCDGLDVLQAQSPEALSGGGFLAGTSLAHLF
nr:hypothetical protein [Arthrobacter sp. 35W]